METYIMVKCSEETKKNGIADAENMGMNLSQLVRFLLIQHHKKEEEK